MKPTDSSRARPLGAGFAILLMCVISAATARDDVIAEWNEALAGYASAPDVLLAPHVQARAYAMTHAAMVEAMAEVNRGRRDARDGDAAQRAAAAVAARDSVTALMPHARAQAEKIAAQQLAAIPDGAGKTKGIACGAAAAALFVRERDNDQWLALVRQSPPYGPLPDYSEQMANAVAAGREPPASPWRNARPFFLRSAAQMKTIVPYFTAVDGSVRKGYAVLDSKLFTTIDRSQPAGVLQQTWAGNPLAAWNRVARAIAQGRGLGLTEQARLFAVLNAALADATLSAMHWRFTLGTWDFMNVETWEDGRGQPMVSTDVTAPAMFDGLHRGVARLVPQRVLIRPMLNYPSILATLAGAAQAVMAEYLKDDRVGFTLELPGNAEGGGPMRRGFGSVAEAARESAFVATLDGRHTREAGIAGHQLGAAIGRHVARGFATARR